MRSACNISKSQVYEGSSELAALFANEKAFANHYKYFSYSGLVFETMNPHYYTAPEAVTDFFVWELKED